MPIFSLPSEYGMGSFGEESYKFVDFLKKSGQKLWQVLPLVQTGYGNSPYSSVSSESFNPYFISIETLKSEGLLTDAEIQFARTTGERIDYSGLYAVRFPLLRSAFQRFNKSDKKFKRYVESKKSYDYALFMAIKYASGQKHFYDWDEGLKRREESAIRQFAESYEEELLFWQFIQYKAEEQWLSLKKYANKNGVSIIGDMPLYVAADSVDVWVNPSLYKLDEKLKPKKVAGVPPDYFCEDGQLWGNPVYDYEAHKKDNFNWWAKRLVRALEVFDYVRIDHFRGLDRYFEIDCDKQTAKDGVWVDVPSIELFNRIHQEIDKNRIIAEDLGIIDEGVHELLAFTGYPGMKILSFAFNGDSGNLYLPERIEENSVCYTGTHDNDTLLGLIYSATEWDKNNLVVGVKSSLNKMGIYGRTDDDKSLKDSIIELGYACKANTFMIPFADLLGKYSEYRINEPGTCSDRNWAVRFNREDFSDELALKIKLLTKKYKR